MRITRKRTGAIIAVLMASVLALSGCSAGDSGKQRAWVGVVHGDPMNFGLNAQLAVGTAPLLFSAQILDPLIFLSADGKFSPALAKSWKLSDDGLTLTLQIRQGVKWHDGKPFTAEDVKFNFDEIVPLQVYGAELTKKISSVEIDGKNTVVIHLTEPYGPLIAVVSSEFMLPKHIYEGTDYLTNKANKKPIGTGPMMFDTYTPGSEVALKKNPDYWGGKVKVDHAIYTVIADGNTSAEALFAREVDEVVLDPAAQARVSKDKNTKLLESGSFPQDVHMMFNAKNKYLADPAVRRAVFSAIDRKALVKTALAGLGTPAKGFFPPSLDWAVNPDVNFDTDFPYNVDATNKALDEAGLKRGPDGTRFTIKALYITALHDIVSVVEMAQSMLQKVGIKLELNSVGGAAYVDKLYKQHDFDLAFVRGPIGPDPSLGIANWYECNKAGAIGRNPSGICDPQIDANAAAALATTDQSKRGVAFKAMQARAEELMFYAPLAWYNGAFPTISTANWKGQDAPRVMAERRPWLTMTPAQ
ncbi:ABC transporter substrate-binding protein [Leifsonia sp. Root112D2]|uniref:ABC transporter substrate-binding protein n=1 Tax=Leifsonia sp. Root112D2 TaxID=1736426 RepID=UPI000A7EAC21|nr:ABC transporter substrate-binding protein [Leifsonia sp. Root112D2]